jgi:hypothetical protein
MKLLVLTFALGCLAAGCGPKQKFCADAGNFVCEAPYDAGPVDSADAPEDTGLDGGTIYIGGDASTAN